MELAKWQPSPLIPRMQRWFDDTFPNWPDWPDWDKAALSMGAWNPRVDMFEKDDNLIVEAEVPGVKREDLDVRVEDHRLTLRGELHEEKKTTDEDYYRHERRTGSFVRSLSLPSNVAADKVDATYKDGILRLKFPKTEESKGKRIAVK